MSNLAINVVPEKITESNYLDFSSFRAGLLLKEIKKNNQEHSLFLFLDKNNDGVLNTEEFDNFKKMSTQEIIAQTHLNPIEKAKKILDKNEITRKLIEAEISLKTKKILELKEEKKDLLKTILTGVCSGSALGLATKIILGCTLLSFVGISTTTLMLILLNHHLHNKKIDAKIKTLEVEIALLNSALILSS